MNHEVLNVRCTVLLATAVTGLLFGCQLGQSGAEREWRNDAETWLDQRVRMPMDALDNALTPQQVFGTGDVQKPTTPQVRALTALAHCGDTLRTEVGAAPTDDTQRVEETASEGCSSIERAARLLRSNLNDRRGFAAWNEASDAFATVWDDLH